MKGASQLRLAREAIHAIAKDPPVWRETRQAALGIAQSRLGKWPGPTPAEAAS